MSGPGGAGTATGTGPGTGHRRPPLRNYTACRPAKAGSNHGAATGGATASLTSVTDSQIDGAATSGPFVSNSSVNNTLAYDRMRDLPRLLRLWPKDIETLDRPALQSLVERLEKALRAERRRGIARHWGYDLGRHAALLRAYRGECACLAQTPA